MGGDLAGDGDDRDGVHHGIDEAGDEIGGAGAGGGAADADFAGAAGVSLRGEAGILLMTDEDVLNRMVVEGVVKRERDAARVAEEAIDVFLSEAFQ